MLILVSCQVVGAGLLAGLVTAAAVFLARLICKITSDMGSDE